MLTSGLLLADRYLLTSRIAVGGMGEVWKAEDTRLDRRVAVKVLKPELCGDEEFLHRFRTEARTTASLNHPSIAAVHDYGETTSPSDPGEDAPRDTAYLVMELVEGEPLSAIISREGRVSPELTLDVLEQAGHALQAAHERGYVHRDVKPGNILIVPGNPVVVKLTDFGIAKAADAVPVTRSGMVMGTAHYVAPEMAVGQEAEPASDVYSLAVVGYECLVGHRPFLSENAVTVAMMHIRDLPPPLPPDVPPGLRALVESTLTKDPRQRYASGGEFAAAVAAVRAGGPPPPPSGLTPAGLAPVGRPVLIPHQQQAVGAPVPGYPTPPHQLGPTTTPTRTQPPFSGQLAGPPSMPGQTSGPISGPVSGPVVPGYPTPPPARPGGGRPWLWVVFALVLVALLALGALLAPRVFGASMTGEVADVRFATPTETAAGALTAQEQGMMDRNFFQEQDYA